MVKEGEQRHQLVPTHIHPELPHGCLPLQLVYYSPVIDVKALEHLLDVMGGLLLAPPGLGAGFGAVSGMDHLLPHILHETPKRELRRL